MNKKTMFFLLVASLFLSSCSCSRNGSNDDETQVDKDSQLNDSTNSQDEDAPDNDSINPDWNNNDGDVETDKDGETVDDSDKCFDVAQFSENGAGNESCPCQNNVDRIKRSINDVTGSEKGNTMKIEEVIYLEDRNEVIPKGIMVV